MKMREVPLFVVERHAKNPSIGAPRYKISLVKEAGSVYVASKTVTNAQDVFDIARAFFADADREMFYVLCLDKKNRVIGVNLVSIGTLSQALVHPREVFKAAILLDAASIIAIHNHLSDTWEPSAPDHRITDKLRKAGEILGIPLKDHVICTKTSFFAFEHKSSYKKA